MFVQPSNQAAAVPQSGVPVVAHAATSGGVGAPFYGGSGQPSPLSKRSASYLTGTSRGASFADKQLVGGGVVMHNTGTVVGADRDAPHRNNPEPTTITTVPVTKSVDRPAKHDSRGIPVPTIESRQGSSSSGAVCVPGTVTASASSQKQFTYNAERIIGNGSFGVVYQAQVMETNETVAIKKVFQDRRYKNRELQIMQELRQPNIVQLKHAFYTSGEKRDELFLNVVMEYLGETVYRVMKQYHKSKQEMPMLYVKLYTYQMCRALAYIHSLGICHRDIKPQNLLVHTSTHVLKLCDFGSAKRLTPGEPNVAYICSRYYRAPELIFGATDYTTAIDIWSMGCVMAEMILGQPLFPGDCGVDQLVEIIKVLGTPTREQLTAMNPTYTEFKFPQIKPVRWERVFKNRPSPDAIDMLTRLLQYEPGARIRPIEALCQPFFDELRDQSTRLPNLRPLQNIFNFTEDELAQCTPEMRGRLVPRWARKLPETIEYLSGGTFEEVEERLARKQVERI